MAKNKKKKRRKGFNISTLFKFVRIGAFVAPAVARAIGSGAPVDKLKMGLRAYTGFNMYNNKFELGAIAEGWLPYLATSAISHGVQKLTGIIRSL